MEETSTPGSLRSKAEAAIERLWEIAECRETPQAERVKLWQWFVALGIGTPRQISEHAAGADGCGIVILPAVMAATEPPADVV